MNLSDQSLANQWSGHEILKFSRRYFVTPCCIIGIPGNLLVLITLLRSNCGLASSARLCYLVIAAADSITLLAYFYRNLPYLFEQFWSWPYTTYNSDLLCQIERCLTWFGIGMSSSAVLIMCIERTYFVYRPLRIKSHGFFTQTQLAMAAAFVLHIVFRAVQAPHFRVIRRSNERLNACTMSDSLTGAIIGLFYCLCNVLFQALQAVLTVLFVRKVVQASNRRVSLLATRPAPCTMCRERLVTICVATMSVAYMLILIPQFINILGYMIQTLCPSFTPYSSRFIRNVVLILGQADAILWCINVFVLLRMPHFRKAVFCVNSAPVTERS